MEKRNDLRDRDKLELQDDIIETLREYRFAQEEYQSLQEECSKLLTTPNEMMELNEAHLEYEIKKNKLYSKLDEYDIKLRFMGS